MRCFFYALLFIFLSAAARAEIIMQKKDGAIYVKSANTAEAEALFKQYDYNDFTKIRGEYPRIFFSKLPSDWSDIPENEAKKRTFIRILLPLVLKVNENIAKERRLVEQLANKLINKDNLSDKEIASLEQMAEKYEVFTKLQGDERIRLLLKRLSVKVDEVPPSLLIASAAVYTDWGNSRLSAEANSLYLEEIWYQKQGMRPRNDPNAEYRYKIYTSLEESIADRALKYNSHVNYDYLRQMRRQERLKKHPPYGPQMTAQLLHDNNFRNIAGLIDHTLTYYKLTQTDYFPKLRDIE